MIKKKKRSKMQTQRKIQPREIKMSDPTETHKYETPKLLPLPNKNNSLWRPEGGKLIVEVGNDGLPITRPVKVKVIYHGSYGDPPKFDAQEQEISELKNAETKKLYFELPNEDSFEPDFDEFDFYIIIDEGGPWECTKNPTGNKKFK